jgi:hypothetical protein
MQLHVQIFLFFRSYICLHASYKVFYNLQRLLLNSSFEVLFNKWTIKENSVVLVRKPTIPIRRQSAKLVPTLADRGCCVVSATNPSDRNFDSLDLEPLLFIQVAPQIVHEAELTPFQTHCCSEKFGNAGNRTWDPCVSSQTLWPLDHRGGLNEPYYLYFYDSCKFAFSVLNK